MSHTIPQVALDANTLYNELTAGLDLSLDFPDFQLPAEIPLPDETGPAYDNLPPLTVEQLTSKTVDGTGVFDVLMQAVTAHLEREHKANRITGGDYAKVYLGSLTQVLAQSTQFLLARDRAVLENLQLQEAIKLAQAQRVRALVEAQTARGQLHLVQVELANAKMKARTAANELALSKMSLITGYNEALSSEAQVKLVNEQIEVQRAQTWDTHLDGTPISGLLGKQKALADAQMQTQLEELDTKRANTKDTLLNGDPISGLVAIEKAFKEAQQRQMEYQGQLTLKQVEVAHAQISDLMLDGQTPIAGILAVEKALKRSQQQLTEEQYEAARAQTKDTLSNGKAITGLIAVEKMIKQAQKLLTEEQIDTQRAQTKDTLTSGAPVSGIAAKEKSLKDAQTKYVLEQYESQRGQTRGTLSTGERVVGLIGAQTRLYEQQIISYKRDAEAKGVKMLLDTWTARKTIDEGVAVPSAIDGASLNSAISTYRTNLGI